VTPGTSELASYLAALADSEIMYGDLEAAKKHELQALEIAERHTPGGRELIAPLTGLGFVSLYSGDLDAAEEYFARTVELKKKHGEDPVDLACSLLNMGLVPLERQDFAAARRCFKKVIELLEEHAPEHPNKAKALSNLAEMAFRQGDDRAAVEYARQALPMFEKTMPGSIDHSMALTRMGMAASAEGDFKAAMNYHRQAMAIRERHLPGSDLTAESLHFMAAQLIDHGELEKAERYQRRAFRIVKNETANMTAAQIGDNLGLIERAKGNYAEAERLFTFALTNWANYGGPEHRELADVYNDLSGLFLLQGRHHEAMGSALRAEAIYRNHYRWTARSLPEEQALAYGWSTSDVVLSLADAFADRVPQAPSLALDAVVRSRAIILDEVAARNRVIASGADPEIAHLADELTVARERFASLFVRGAGGSDPKTYRAALDKAHQERDRIEGELAYKSRSFRVELARSAAGLEEVIAQLPPGTALVAYVVYHRYDTVKIPITWGNSSGCGSPWFSAFVARPDAPPVMVSLGEVSAIDRRIEDLRLQIAAVAAAPGRSLARSERSYRSAGAGLRQVIWDPLLPHLADVDHVLVVPDGALNIVSLAALPVGESEYLIDTGPRIHYLSTERDLVVADDLPDGRGLLVVGDPSFDEPRLFAALRPAGDDSPFNDSIQLASTSTFRGGVSSCADFHSMRFEELPASRDEVDHVVDLWQRQLEKAPRLRGPSDAAQEVLVLTGPAANEAALKATAERYRVLHLATHGFFIDGKCRSVFETAAEVDQRHGASAPLHIESPFLLAGLALAGANHRKAARPEEEDGILTAEEIATLDLSGVEWAVLSACDTGVGELSAGEGVFGLRRAFQVAGVRTLIMSLWPVDDEASRTWMRKLYENRLVHGASTIDSVHDASLAVLEERRQKGLSTHPFYWAGFIASGDWR